MYSSTLSAFVVVIAVAVLNLDSTHGAPQVTCKTIMSDMTKRQLGGIAKCTKSMKFKNGKDKAAKMTCILKCVMANEGILSAEGLMDKETFEKFLEKEVPEMMKENAKRVLGKCQSEHSEKLDPKEEFCKSYDPLIKCFMMSIMQLCPS